MTFGGGCGRLCVHVLVLVSVPIGRYEYGCFFLWSSRVL